MRSTVNADEARVEMYTALLVILLFILFLLGRISDPLAMFVGGVILLGSGVYQTLRGWHVALTTWVVGILLFLGGIGVRMFVVAYLPINFVGVGLALAALYFVSRLFTRHR
jgi:hypothetical protein